VAGVRALTQRGMIGRDERVVAVLTGHLLKDPAADPSTKTGESTEEALTPADALALLERIVATR
jgi:threonine synthase